MSLTVRPAQPEDVVTMMAMLRELAAFEQAPPGALQCSEDDLRRDGFGPQARFTCLLAEADGRVIGFVNVFATYSSWLGRPGLMVHDLFVRPQDRGQGAGGALIRAVARLGVERGCGRIDVNVLAWNEARGFYEQLGFSPQADWVLHRLEGDALVRAGLNTTSQ
jgi:GNAT superfamily N-acetyltransferase